MTKENNVPVLVGGNFSVEDIDVLCVEYSRYDTVSGSDDMNILLLRPPRRGFLDLGLSVPPMGLAYIAGSLLKAGHSVQILDAYALGWSWKHFKQWMQSRSFDMIGLTVMTHFGCSGKGNAIVVPLLVTWLWEASSYRGSS